MHASFLQETMCFQLELEGVVTTHEAVTNLIHKQIIKCKTQLPQKPTGELELELAKYLFIHFVRSRGEKEHNPHYITEAKKYLLELKNRASQEGE